MNYGTRPYPSFSQWRTFEFLTTSLLFVGSISLFINVSFYSPTQNMKSEVSLCMCLTFLH